MRGKMGLVELIVTLEVVFGLSILNRLFHIVA